MVRLHVEVPQELDFVVFRDLFCSVFVPPLRMWQVKLLAEPPMDGGCHLVVAAFVLRLCKLGATAGNVVYCLVVGAAQPTKRRARIFVNFVFDILCAQSLILRRRILPFPF